jgi:hypothetical protein
MTSVPKPTQAAIKRYDTVMQVLTERFPAVMPVRFGTLVEDVDELAFVIASRRESFVRVLRLVRHRVQMSVRLVGAEGATRIRSGAQETRQPKSGTEYLSGLVSAAREFPGLEAVRAAVAHWTVEERVETHPSSRRMIALYHLIPRSSVAVYCRAIRSVKLAPGVTALATGPWPPYAFAGEVAGSGTTGKSSRGFADRSTWLRRNKHG